MNKFRNWLARVMYGRYGQDQLNFFILIVAMIIFVVSLFTTNWVYLGSVVLIGYAYFRALSRNIVARRKENNFFLKNTAWVRKLFGKGTGSYGGANYKVFKCPSCKQKLRVPRGRGKIEIRCKKCGTTFVRRS